MNNFFLPSFRRRENQKRETSGQSEGSEIIEGVLWVHGAWENGERRIFLMLGHGFREISSLYIILSEPNMSETEIKTIPIQCGYPFYTGADLRPVKAPWAPPVNYGARCNVLFSSDIEDGELSIGEETSESAVYKDYFSG